MSKKKEKQAEPPGVRESDRPAEVQLAADPKAGPDEQRNPSTGEAARTKDVAAELASLQAELENAEDRTLRIRAELENYRKRAARELQEQFRYANLPFMRELLPVLDNMERAVEAAEKSHHTADLLEGVRLVMQQFKDALQQYDCTRIEALHQPFDPHLHEAISQQTSHEHPAGTVLLVTQTGYLLHDRVVRPSQVIVSTDVPDKHSDDPTER